ncbi:callose synthase 3-like [Syzygium oleosum]|uniref:callose synthase 3-like n=1 Tax=Syzygium oleosum TaxID=219896 RepID=UPI0024B8995D|nr:callose synthase 3-like [Syzygium oleosum]
MSVRVTKFQWHEFFPRAKDIGVVIALWAPIMLVYFMDTQIWYTLFTTVLGGIYGLVGRLGQRTLRMVRSRFEYLPGVFNARLIGKEKAEPKKDGSEATSSQSNARILSKKEKARFAQLWNTIISSVREDLISNREMNLLLFPYWVDHDLEDIIQWPPFLLARKDDSRISHYVFEFPSLASALHILQIPTALNMAKDSNNKDQELREIIKTGKFMPFAIRECYTQFRNIIKSLVEGERGKEYIKDGNLSSKFKMSALPILYDHFVELIRCLLDNK